MLSIQAPIMWRSKMQKTTAPSSGVHGRGGVLLSCRLSIGDMLYLRKLLDQLGFAQQYLTPVYEDNMACIKWGNNIIGGRGRAKHIDIPTRSFRMVKCYLFEFRHQQLADILTKGLHYQQW